MGKNNDEVYRELSPAGIWLCAGLGVIAEVLVLRFFEIRLASVPIPVLAFLWCLFGILTSGFLFAADAAEMKLQEVVQWLKESRQSNMQVLSNAIMPQMEQDMANAESVDAAQIVYGVFSKKDNNDYILTQKKAS